MAFNQYSVYTEVLNSENKNSEEWENMIPKIRKMRDFGNLDDVKNYLKAEFDIEESAMRKVICVNCSLEISKNNKYTTYDFKLPKKEFSYSYLNNEEE